MINKVILVGNVGKDPDVKHFEDNQSVANFPIATTERGFTTKDGKQIPERTEWHNVSARRGLAGIAEKYVKKGSQLYIEGKLHTRSYQKDGVTMYITEVICETLKLLGRKSDSDNQQAKPVNQNSSQQPGKKNDEPEDDFPF